MAKREPEKSLTTTSDFCFLTGRADARLSDVERLTMLGGSGLARIVSRLGKTLELVSLDAFTAGLEPAQLARDRAALHALRADGTISNLLAPPAHLPAPSIVPVHGFPHGSVLDLEFPSQFPGPDLGAVPQYQRLVENSTSFVRLWEHNDQVQGRTTVVAVHGWTMGDQRVNSLAFMPGLLYSLGANVALVELPFHGRRRPHDVPQEDPLFPSIDPVKTCVAMAHSLHDLRSLAAFLKGRGHDRVACVGMSLGAYVAALWASLDPLHRIALLVPLVSMGDMAFELVKRRFGEASREAQELGLEVMRDLFADHYPLVREPRTAQESVMVIRGKGDQLVSRGQIAILRTAWPRAKYLWAEGGHGAAVERGDTFTRMVEFLLG